VDDGLWFGGSYSWVNHAWRKSPYKSSQGFSFSLAPGSRDAFRVSYHGHFPDALGKLDFAPEVNYNSPLYENYFGLGNNSVNDTNNDIDYNWVRMKWLDIHPRLRYNVGNNGQLDFGPAYIQRDIVNSPGRVSEELVLGFSEDEFDVRRYWGGDMVFNLGVVDNRVFPTNGFLLNVSANHLIESAKEENVTQFDINGQFYFNICNRPRLVFATKVGYAKSFGDLQFHQYQDLGNTSGLRGFRNERFRGESVFYQNMDLRIKLINFDNNFIPMDIGLLGGYDYGRAQLEGENFDGWHSSKTIGLWFDLLGAIVVQPYYSFNEEQNTFSLILGFSF